MATVDELLKKQKGRLDKMSSSAPVPVPTPVARKKITRTGPTRPWQENLPQYQSATPLPVQPEAEPLARTAHKPDTDLDQSSAIAASVPQETGHKSGTICAQTEHKADTKLGTNRTQSEYSSRSHVAALSKTGHKPDTQPDTNKDTNRAQTENKPDTKQGFSSLVGLQREITIFVYESCKNARARITEPLSLEHVALSLNIRIGSVKTTLRRLEEKSILRRDGFKIGRGGWSRYELFDTIYRELLQLETEHKLSTNRAQTGHKLNTQPDTEPDTRRSSSSSSIDSQKFKTTTTGEPELFDDSGVQLSPDWAAVDFTPLADVGFSRAHLIQLAKHGKLSTSEVQDSIHFFAFDLKQNEKGKEIKGAPVNFFMGILRKGMPYAPPENYESPEQTARRIYLEGKRRIEEQREAQERELVALDFAEWRRGLTQEQIVAIVPDVVLHIPRAREESLRAHHGENLWPKRRETIPAAVEAETAAIRREIEQSLGADKQEGIT